MKWIVALLCLWLIGVPAFAADHLEPEESILNIGLGPDWAEQEALYSVIVNTVFAEAFDLHVLIRDVRGPGSDRDSVVGIRTKGRHYELFRIRSKVSLYDYVILKGAEQAATQRRGGSSGGDLNDDIRKRVPKRYQDVATERCAVDIDSETARRLIRVWRTMLHQTRFLDAPREDHYASVLHHFSAALSQQYVMSGKTMEGEATGNAAMLVAVSNAMDEVCQDKTQLADLQKKVTLLEESLRLPSALSPPADDEQGEFPMITQAVFTDGKLWLLRTDGGLFTVTEGKMGSDEIALPETAIDLWLDGNKPVVATCNLDDCQTWTLRRYEQGSWRDVTSIAANGDHWGRAARTPEGTLVVTSRRLIDIGAERTKVTRLQQPLVEQFPVPPSIIASDNDVYIGVYLGEWGGGVWRVDRSSGKIRAVTQHWKSEDGKREGDVSLGAINGLAWEPWQPDCFLAAGGVIHFEASGDMTEVCGSKVRQLYLRDNSDPEKAKDKGPCCTDAYFGLVPYRDGLLAVGLNGLYRITAAGLEPLALKPHYVDYGDVRVSFDVPGIVLVLSSVRARVALSGSTPFLVPR